MLFPVTALYALPLTLLCLVLWVRVSSARARLKVSIGDAGNTALHEAIRRHGNFIEWVALALPLMLIAEGNGAWPAGLHAAGALLVLGRLIHPFGLSAANASHPLRIIGNTASLLTTLCLVGLLFLSTFGS